MSAADTLDVRRPRTLSTRFLRSELRLIFLRRRNQAGLLVLASVPVLISVAVKLSSPGHDRGGPDFFNSITENGLFVALASLTLELGLFLPLAVAAISGDSVAGEANVGTLRYLLTVPVQRARLLGVKYLAIVIFAVVATLTVTLTGVVMGLALFGGGSMTLLSGTQIGFAEGLLRVLLDPPVPHHAQLAGVRGSLPGPGHLGGDQPGAVRRCGLRPRVLAGRMGTVRGQGRHQLRSARSTDNRQAGPTARPANAARRS